MSQKMFEEQSPLAAVLILTGAKQEVRDRCCTVLTGTRLGLMDGSMEPFPVSHQ